MSVYREEIQNVLLAEDDDEDFEFFADVIQHLSLKVILTRAINGDILMRVLDERTPDILFLDIHMPCKNGRDCLKEIRLQKKFDDLPIIIYSGVNDFDTIEFCYRQGSNLYVVKPTTYKELVDAIEKTFAINWKKMMYYPTLSNFVLNPH
jgi:response regulator RpfG family c-di-GMP phosphodiesterase